MASSAVGPSHWYEIVTRAREDNAKTLDLSGTSIGEEIGAVLASPEESVCATLTTLLLVRSSIGDKEAESLATTGLTKHQNLLVLNLSWNRIGPEGARHLANGLKCCANLTNLDLSRNGIGDDGVAALASVALPACKRIVELNLYSNSIGQKGAQRLAYDGLEHCGALKTFNLGDNKIGEEGIRAIAGNLGHCVSLISLNLVHNLLGGGGVKVLAQVGFGQCTSIEEIDVSLNGIGTRGILEFARGLARLENLAVLNVSGNSLEGRVFAENLPRCERLRSLDLSSNTIVVEGVAALVSRGLANCPNLTELNLSDNNLGPGGAEVLSRNGLPEGVNLSVLNLSSCRLHPEGAATLATGLVHYKSLTALHLGFNWFGSEGAVALAKQGLPHCGELRILDLEDNDIGEEGFQSIGEALLAGRCPLLERIAGDEKQLPLSCKAALSAMELPIEWEDQKDDSTILGFHRLRCQGGSTRFAAAKVLISGPALAGKTCLASALVRDLEKWHEHYKDQRSTQGMEVVKWEPPPKDLSFAICYDFGGQEVYKASHRLFMGSCTVYLVVWNPRASHRDSEGYEEYARDVLDEQPDAKILFVSTHKDLKSDKYPGEESMERILRQKFGAAFAAYVDVDLTPESGCLQLERLRGLVEEKLMSLPNVILSLPRSFEVMKQGLLALPQRDKLWISEKEFQILAKKYGCLSIGQQETKSDQDFASDHGMAREALLLFDQWGFVKILSGTEGNIHIALEPGTVAEALAQVITPDPTKQERCCPAGFITNTTLEKVWTQYPEAVRKGFMSLIEELGLGFSVRDETGKDHQGMLILPMLRGSQESMRTTYRMEVEARNMPPQLWIRIKLDRLPNELVVRLQHRVRAFTVIGEWCPEGSLLVEKHVDEQDTVQERAFSMILVSRKNLTIDVRTFGESDALPRMVLQCLGDELAYRYAQIRLTELEVCLGGLELGGYDQEERVDIQTLETLQKATQDFAEPVIEAPSGRFNTAYILRFVSKLKKRPPELKSEASLGRSSEQEADLPPSLRSLRAALDDEASPELTISQHLLCAQSDIAMLVNKYGNLRLKEKHVLWLVYSDGNDQIAAPLRLMPPEEWDMSHPEFALQVCLTQDPSAKFGTSMDSFDGAVSTVNEIVGKVVAKIGGDWNQCRSGTSPESHFEGLLWECGGGGNSRAGAIRRISNERFAPVEGNCACYDGKIWVHNEDKQKFVTSNRILHDTNVDSSTLLVQGAWEDGEDDDVPEHPTTGPTQNSDEMAISQGSQVPLKTPNRLKRPPPFSETPEPARKRRSVEAASSEGVSVTRAIHEGCQESSPSSEALAVSTSVEGVKSAWVEMSDVQKRASKAIARCWQRRVVYSVGGEELAERPFAALGMACHSPQGPSKQDTMQGYEDAGRSHVAEALAAPIPQGPVDLYADLSRATIHANLLRNLSWTRKIILIVPPNSPIGDDGIVNSTFPAISVFEQLKYRSWVVGEEISSADVVLIAHQMGGDTFGNLAPCLYVNTRDFLLNGDQLDLYDSDWELTMGTKRATLAKGWKSDWVIKVTVDGKKGKKDLRNLFPYHDCGISPHEAMVAKLAYQDFKQCDCSFWLRAVGFDFNLSTKKNSKKSAKKTEGTEKPEKPEKMEKSFDENDRFKQLFRKYLERFQASLREAGLGDLRVSVDRIIEQTTPEIVKRSNGGKSRRHWSNVSNAISCVFKEHIWPLTRPRRSTQLVPAIPMVFHLPDGVEDDILSVWDPDFMEAGEATIL